MPRATLSAQRPLPSLPTGSPRSKQIALMRDSIVEDSWRSVTLHEPQQPCPRFCLLDYQSANLNIEPMAGGEDTRRSGLTIQAIDPIDGKTCAVLISHGRLQFMKQLGLRAIHETAKMVPLALQKPTAIFEGLSDEQDEEKGLRGAGWRCYVTKPTTAFKATGAQHPAPTDQVFVVFVN